MNSRNQRLFAGVGFVFTVSAASSLAWSGTFRHDVSGDLGTHVDYGDGFRMIGGVQVDFSSFGSGVLIDNQWVLTSAHVIAGASPGSYIKFETDPDPDDPVFSDPDYDPEDWESLPLSGLFRVDAVAIHEFYDDILGPAGGFDIALLHLDAPITHTHPDYQPYARFTGSDEIGRQGTTVGFGATGTGQTGYIAETGAFFRLAGDNMIDSTANDPRIVGEFAARTVTDSDGNVLTFTKEQIARQFLLSDFDDPATQSDDPSTTNQNESHVNDGLNPLGDDDPLTLEYSVAPGDSGGPLLVNVDGVWQLAGVNAFIHGLSVANGGDGTDNATYSDLAGYLRVSEFNDWIDEVLASDLSGLIEYDTTGEPVNDGRLEMAPARLTVPEPTSAAAAFALIALAARRRRKQ